MEIPSYIPKPALKEDKTLLDPVKEAFYALGKYKNLKFQDFEVSGALMRLNMHRYLKSDFSLFENERVSFLSQISYLLSLANKNPNLSALILEPKVDDLNNILDHLEVNLIPSREDTPKFEKDLSFKESNQNFLKFFNNVDIKEVITKKSLKIPKKFLEKDFLGKKQITAYAYLNGNKISKIVIPKDLEQKFSTLKKGKILFENEKLFFYLSEKKYEILKSIEIFIPSSTILKSKIVSKSLLDAMKKEDIQLDIKANLQGLLVKGIINFKNIKIFKATPKVNFTKQPKFSPFWAYKIKNKIFLNDSFVLLPKSLKNSGILLGDGGYLSYSATTATSTQEHRLPIYVAGFYDPGILSIGNRCIIVKDNITKTISSSNTLFSPEGIPDNGIFVWTDDISKVDKIKNNLERDFSKISISPYWKIETYKDYKFSKDLLEQFQSDRMLFTLIGVIILIVACCNIISLLVLLVNDKKKEIATLQAMGASKKSIILIFGSCGIIIGVLSSFLGILAAIFTLKNLSVLVNFLNFIQGREVFNPSFFGDKLPNTFSVESLIFILIITPIISLLAGLIPAIKAAKLNPSKILRS
jgi:lipoprotein-releasing system permease protein